MRFPQLVTLVVLGGLCVNCSGSTSGAVMDVPMPDADLSGGIVNPDGTAYPTANIGGKPRTATQAGQVFPDLTLEGVRSAATMDT